MVHEGRRFGKGEPRLTIRWERVPFRVYPPDSRPAARDGFIVNPWNREDKETDQEYDNYEEEDDDLEEEHAGEWELDPSDPEHPDFDLSEAAGDWAWRPQKSPIVLRRGFVFFVSLLLVVVILIPVFLRLIG